MTRALWLIVGLLAAAALLSGCGGAHTANVEVGVSNEAGQPMADAEVWISGSTQKTTTNSTGNATLKGLKPGVYQIEAGTNGYFRQHRTVTITSSGQPAPMSITLPTRLRSAPSSGSRRAPCGSCFRSTPTTRGTLS